MHVLMLAQEFQCRRHGNDRTVVPAHAVDSDGNCHPENRQKKRQAIPIPGIVPPDLRTLLARTLGNLLATVVARGANMVAQMGFTCRRLNSQRRVGQKIVGTMHTPLGRGFLVLLNGHS